MRLLMLVLALAAMPAAAQVAQVQQQTGLDKAAVDGCRRDTIFDGNKSGADKMVQRGSLCGGSYVPPGLVDMSAAPPQSLGPFTRFGNPMRAQTVDYSIRGAPAETLSFTRSIIRDTPGSGVFGPRGADVALHLGCSKTRYLVSTIEGEVDCGYIIATQGKRGDLSGLLIDVAKRRDQLTVQGSDESGAPSVMEGTTSLINASGDTYHTIHTIPAFDESTGGLSGGRGYGEWTHVERGSFFAAFAAQGDQVSADAWTANTVYSVASIVTSAGHLYTPANPTGCTSGSTAPTQTQEHLIFVDGSCRWQVRDAKFENLLIGADNSSPASIYFYIDGAGNIRQGRYNSAMTMGFDPAGAAGDGIWRLYDEANDAKLVVGRVSGVVTALHGFQIGGGEALIYQRAKQLTADLPSVAGWAADVVGYWNFPGSIRGDMVTVAITSIAAGFNAWRLFGVVMNDGGDVQVRAQNISPNTAGGYPVGFTVKVERFTQ